MINEETLQRLTSMREKLLERLKDALQNGCGFHSCPISVFKSDAMCTLSPEDIPASCLTDESMMHELLMSGKYSIDICDVDFNHDPWNIEMLYYIRMRKRYAPVMDNHNIGSTCIMMTDDHKCSIVEDRPLEGKMIIFGKAWELDEMDRALLWLPYQELLKNVSTPFLKDYTLGIPDDESKTIVRCAAQCPNRINNMRLYVRNSPQETCCDEILILKGSDSDSHECPAQIVFELGYNRPFRRWSQSLSHMKSLSKYKLVADIDFSVDPDVNDSIFLDSMRDAVIRQRDAIGKMVASELFPNEARANCLLELTTIDKLIYSSYTMNKQLINQAHCELIEEIYKAVLDAKKRYFINNDEHNSTNDMAPKEG